MLAISLSIATKEEEDKKRAHIEQFYVASEKLEELLVDTTDVKLGDATLERWLQFEDPGQEAHSRELLLPNVSIPPPKEKPESTINAPETPRTEVRVNAEKIL